MTGAARSDRRRGESDALRSSDLTNQSNRLGRSRALGRATPIVNRWSTVLPRHCKCLYQNRTELHKTSPKFSRLDAVVRSEEWPARQYLGPVLAQPTARPR
jgi:hypothetical protein